MFRLRLVNDNLFQKFVMSKQGSGIVPGKKKYLRAWELPVKNGDQWRSKDDISDPVSTDQQDILEFH
jgi:hypothetical protein